MDPPYNIMLVCVRCSSAVDISHDQFVVRNCIHNYCIFYLLFPLFPVWARSHGTITYNYYNDYIYTSYYKQHVLIFLSYISITVLYYMMSQGAV